MAQNARPHTNGPVETMLIKTDLDAAAAVVFGEQEITYQLEYSGASEGNPGFAGGAAILRDPNEPNGKEICSICLGVGEATEDMGAYRGLIEGMRQAFEFGMCNIKVQGESQFVQDQLDNDQVDSDWEEAGEEDPREFRLLHTEAIMLKDHFINFEMRLVDREHNSAAYALATKGINLPERKFESQIPTVNDVMRAAETSSSSDPSTDLSSD